MRAGELYYGQKQYDKAAAALGHAAKLSAANATLRAQALHLLGWARFDAGQFEPALQAFRGQLKADPSGPLAVDGRVMIGECLYAAEDYPQALATYEESLTTLPGNEELATLALLHAGQAAGQVGKWVESLDWLDQASKANGNAGKRDEIQYERGWAMVNLKRPAGAKPIFEKLVDSTDGVLGARSRFMLGELQFADKEYEKAVRTFFRVAYGYGGRDAPPEYHPWQAESLFEAARCLEELGRKEPAAKLYAELLERFPESAKARHAEARLQAGVSR